MNILVTGGAGFIGSHLVHRLIELGHHVWTLDDMSTGRLHFLDEATESNRHSMIHGSVTDKELLKGLIERCDVVFHLAAVLGVKNTVENPLKVIEGNIDGTRNVLELAMKYGAKVVFASTSEIYGKNSKLPFKEDSDRVLGDPSIHRWCYATAKAIDEHLCFAYAEQGLPVTVVRYFNAYGPRQTSSQYGGVVPRFIKAALANEPLEVHGDGSQIRCFTFIRDTVEGTVAAMEPAANGLAFNIGSERPIAIVDLAHRIVKLAGSSSPVVFIPHAQAYGPGFEDMAARIPDISRARRILQYEPSVSLEEGLQLSIDWYKRQQKAGG
ncbi:NAD-dependent epimerase/dehydratase family protein [Paenibacillus doosanensis]|uniref:NAD-dependent epimerase/dehydratase family protein n=1 Tax=Paenibacillus doosanensis TaxID=1229154 RepID=UPI00217F7E81|nr:NAD-dependent epimerase/dehydratase family protein [Paenibacillus doosanensis]MCS7458829.1 NAD-dependent epimerase/dehydratase family protein [Paenibacillus doosanensis]